MDQRIEELALKCGAWHQVYGNRNFMLDEHFDITKFAQLIVRECADICMEMSAKCAGLDRLMKENLETGKALWEQYCPWSATNGGYIKWSQHE
jgi:hypothetical protein